MGKILRTMQYLLRITAFYMSMIAGGCASRALSFIITNMASVPKQNLAGTSRCNPSSPNMIS